MDRKPSRTFATQSPHRACCRAASTETSTLRRLKAIARWVSRDRVAAAAGEPAAYVMELRNHVLLLDVTAVYFAGGDLRRGGPSLLRVMAAVGDVDAAIAVASLRAATGTWTRPRFVPPGSPVQLKDVRHPLIAGAVPNSIEPAPPFGVLVTGSNMSGKTTCADR